MVKRESEGIRFKLNIGEDQNAKNACKPFRMKISFKPSL